MVTIPIKKLYTSSSFDLPKYESAGASGLDLRAAIDNNIIIAGSSYKLIKCGFSLAIPSGYEAQVRPRSGLALKHGIFVLNSPGTIDSDYRGEVCVILANFGENDFTVKCSDRIAQLVICPIIQADLSLQNELPDTKRGAGGFGSTDSM